MKFRALIKDDYAMQDFMNICLSLAKFSKVCVMRITSKKVYFIIAEESGPQKPFVWCELPVSFYFQDYNIVGVSEENNEIFLELSTVLLARSCQILKQRVKTFKIKLTHKESPCLTLEVDLAAGDILSRQCVHDIPVEVISKKHWSNYEKPSFDDFHISMQMPNLKSIKNIVERMKNMSDLLTVTANKYGRLTLQIKTPVVSLSAHFPDLNVESFSIDNTRDEENDTNQTVCSTVDIKKFSMFLSGMQLTNCRAVCSIMHENMVKLHMEHPGSMSLEIFLSEKTI